MNSSCAEYFDWLINEREPYPDSLEKELLLSEETGRKCSVVRGPVLTVSKNLKKGECVPDGKENE